MTRITSTALVLACAIPALCAPPLAAQSTEEQSAYVALIYTPVAGLPLLPPLLDAAASRTASGVVLQGRFGHLSRQGGLTLTTLGAGVELPAGRWRVGGTLAYLSGSCSAAWAGDSQCAGDIMVGGSARTILTTRPLGSEAAPSKGRRASRSSGSGTFVLGFDASAGFSPRQGEQAFALAGGLPAALVFETGDVKVIPFLTPALAYGRLGSITYFEDEPPTSSGTFVFMVGGGFALQFGRSGIGASAGFQRVLKSSGGATQIGIGMTWQGLSASR